MSSTTTTTRSAQRSVALRPPAMLGWPALTLATLTGTVLALTRSRLATRTLAELDQRPTSPAAVPTSAEMAAA